jgi:hypothetical protein
MSSVPDTALECASGSAVEVDALIKAASATVPLASTALRVRAPAALTAVVPVNGVLTVPMRDIDGPYARHQGGREALEPGGAHQCDHHHCGHHRLRPDVGRARTSADASGAPSRGSYLVVALARISRDAKDLGVAK